MAIDRKTKIGELLSEHPRVVELFLKRGLSCATCPMSSIETIEEIGGSIDIEEFLKEIDEFIKEEA